MNIADIRKVGKRYAALLQPERLRTIANQIPRDVILVAVILLSSSVTFGLGILTGEQLGQGGVIVETLPLATSTANTVDTAPAITPAILNAGRVVASKNGSKYYFPWCGGAKRLSTAHKIWFASAAQARIHGYTKAANCKGL